MPDARSHSPGDPPTVPPPEEGGEGGSPAPSPERGGSETHHPPDWLLSPTLQDAVRDSLLKDPRDLVRQVAARLRQRALLLDPERGYLCTLARIAMYRGQFDAHVPLEEWMSARIDETLEDLLVRDREDERAGVSIGKPYQSRYEYLIDALGILPEKARLACIMINQLDDSRRRVFFEAIVLRTPLRELTRMGWGEREELTQLLNEALRALAEQPIGFRLQEFRPAAGSPFDLEGD